MDGGDFPMRPIVAWNLPIRNPGGRDAMLQPARVLIWTHKQKSENASAANKVI